MEGSSKKAQAQAASSGNRTRLKKTEAKKTVKQRSAAEGFKENQRKQATKHQRDKTTTTTNSGKTPRARSLGVTRKSSEKKQTTPKHPGYVTVEPWTSSNGNKVGGRRSLLGNMKKLTQDHPKAKLKQSGYLRVSAQLWKQMSDSEKAVYKILDRKTPKGTKK